MNKLGPSELLFPVPNPISGAPRVHIIYLNMFPVWEVLKVGTKCIISTSHI